VEQQLELLAATSHQLERARSNAYNLGRDYGKAYQQAAGIMDVSGRYGARLGGFE
jgi:hypothetical protein